MDIIKNIFNKYYQDAIIPIDLNFLLKNLSVGLLLMPNIEYSGKYEKYNQEFKIPLITCNSNMSKVNQKLIIAFELTHHILNEDISTEDIVTYLTPYKNLNMACDILVPPDYLMALVMVRNITDINKLKNMFSVSDKVLLHQLNKLKLL